MSNRWVRALLITLTLAVAVYFLFTVAFPWFELNYVTNPVLEG